MTTYSNAPRQTPAYEGIITQEFGLHYSQDWTLSNDDWGLERKPWFIDRQNDLVFESNRFDEYLADDPDILKQMAEQLSKVMVDSELIVPSTSEQIALLLNDKLTTPEPPPETPEEVLSTSPESESGFTLQLQGGATSQSNTITIEVPILTPEQNQQLSQFIHFLQNAFSRWAW